MHLKPMKTTFETVTDQSGTAFYKACSIGFEQWKLVHQTFDTWRTSLTTKKLQGPLALVPDDDDERVESLLQWLMSSACQQELERRKLGDTALCREAKSLVDDINSELKGVQKEATTSKGQNKAIIKQLTKVIDEFVCAFMSLF